MPRMPLLVHIVFHPDSVEARNLAVGIHNALNYDSLVPGLDIPTVFCDLSAGSPPTDQGLDRATRSFVVVLADNYLAVGDHAENWQDFVTDLWKACQGTAHRFVPIQVSENAWGFSDVLTQACISFGRAFNEAPPTKNLELVCRVVATELARFLLNEAIGAGQTQAPVKFFISHTKSDLDKEPRVVRELVNALTADKPVESWVDSGNIPPGNNFATEIEKGIKESSVMVVLTDNYASREWCRTEVLLAKEYQRPIVVIDALQHHEVRSFPYIGNVPVLRWKPTEPNRAIDLLIKETIRWLHTQLCLDQWKQPDDLLVMRPPELATIAHVKKKTILYPDPPLGSEEIRLLELLGVHVVTPLERMAKRKVLEGKRVAISMSESSDIKNYGFGDFHLENAMIELSRYLLIQGASLSYGGRLGNDGFTEVLFDLVRAHNQIDRTEKIKPILNFSGWPLPEPTVDQRAQFNRVGSFVRVGRPSDVNEVMNEDFEINPKGFPATKSPLHRFAWSLGMTEMRLRQVSQTSARIVMGGKTDKTMTRRPDGTFTESWYSSRIPGVLEEVYFSAKQNQPIFLIGAYGGAAAMIVDLIEGKNRIEASWDFQKAAPYSTELRELYDQHNLEWESYESMIDLLRTKGVGGINSLLTEVENRELFRTIDLIRMTELVIKGLSNL